MMEQTEKPQTPSKRPRRTEATPEVFRTILMALSGLLFLGLLLLYFTEGLRTPVHMYLFLYVAGYRIFYYFFPHDWINEKYYMSHVHLGLALILGFLLTPITDLTQEGLCNDSVVARHIDLNSLAYFIVDTFYLIDTVWVTHHSLSIGCAIFGLAGTTQTVGGAVYVWYAEIGGLLYHISRIWPDSQRVREIFLVCYFTSRMLMIWISTISWRCSFSLFNNAGFSVEFMVAFVLSCFTSGLAMVNLKFLYTNIQNYIKRFHSGQKRE